jgi:TIR domain
MNEQFPYDVFLSYRSRDKAVVRAVAERLHRDGLQVWFDEWMLKPGDAIPAKIEDGLEHSRVLVLCMSANAFGSDWTQLETGTFRFRDPLNQERRFIPLRLDDTPIKGSLAQFFYIDWRSEASELEYAKLLEACRHPATWPQATISRDTLPVKKRESLQANLLPLVRWPNKIFTARTRFRRPENLTAKAKQLGGYLGREWFLKSSKVVSFRPLDAHPWPKLITGKPLSPVDTDSWAWSDDLLTQRDFVRLLNQALAGFLAELRLWRFKVNPSTILYFFARTRDGVERRSKWGPRDSERTVVQKVTAKKDPTRIVCYRHHAFIPSFVRFGNRWYLIIEPTYHFTTDGEKPSRYRESYLSGLKRLEKHQAVCNNVRFWSHYLINRELFDARRELIAFATAEHFSLDSGIPDADWLRNADADEREHLGVDEEPTGKLVVDDKQQLAFVYET